MAKAEPFTLTSRRLGCLPVLNHFLDRIGLSEHLESYLPGRDGRMRLAPATVIGVAVANIVVSHRPVYALAEWAGGYDPALLGLSEGDAGALSDDRVGRMLDRLFDTDRASLVTETILGVIGEFNVDVTQLHNDSTTITVTGAYRGADGYARGGKKTAVITQGHNKDFRPDLSQLLWVYDRRRWGGPDRLPGRRRQHPRRPHPHPDLGTATGPGRDPQFLYVADSKLCSKEAMGHIARHGGRFVTVMPHGRRADTWCWATL